MVLLEKENNFLKNEDKNNDGTPKNTIPNNKPKSRYSFRETSEPGQDKPINDANRRKQIIINSYPENDKVHDK